MYFVARQHGTGNQVVGVAEAHQPGGPYKPAGRQPLVTQVRRVPTLCVSTCFTLLQVLSSACLPPSSLTGHSWLQHDKGGTIDPYAIRAGDSLW